MQKTQLTVLINQLELSIAHMGEPEDEYNKGIVVAYQSCLETAIELLPKEREDMEKAYADGFEKAWGDGTSVQVYEHEEIDNSGSTLEKEYFNQTFTQYKP